MNKPKIVILGAGYAGLTTVARLQKTMNASDAEVILINKNDFHYETTWLHEASAGTRDCDRVCYDIADVLKKEKITFIKDEIVEIKKDEQKVILSNGEVSYDYLVIGVGAIPETFGIKGLQENAFMISNVEGARKIREHIESKFANYHSNKNEDQLTFVVGGAGFTGIEFLGELVNRVPELCKEHKINPNDVKILCVEAAPTVLPGFDKDLVDYAVKFLEDRGVEFRIGTAIKECTETGIVVSHGEETEEIPAGTVIWAAGVRGNPLVENCGIETMRGRVKVDKDLRAPGEKNIFVIGDSSLFINEEIDRPYPPTAQIAMQQAEICAKNLKALVRGEQTREFVPNLKGSVCSLGEKDAIGLVFGKKLKGKPASFMKKVIDNRALFMVGGVPLVMKKGKFNIL
ncbi:NAD(P)/FAD-dependent oxidoreductase [Bacillus sp. 1P06AnD]|uniref:NAD(P)/FAD-dependent oxidoreductase n=1 Tax=Bacillus sp. 1P06AnD TaxID=3132208 RepID=UPI0039A2604D